MAPHLPHNILIRRPAVQECSGYRRSTLYARIKSGLWTKPIAIGARAVAWPLREVEALNAAKIAGKLDDEIRAQVRELEAARACAGQGAESRSEAQERSDEKVNRTEPSL